jgi:endonuclease I
MNNKSVFALLGIFFNISICISQIPPGYYDAAEGLYGEELRAALQQIIDDHNIQSNANLWIHFQSSDVKENGKVWDMYSDVPGGTPAYEYTFTVDQCGSYTSEGDCYNREHSFPQSWYGDSPPMSTDLFHIYPTDGWVNAQRSNWPFGEVGNVNWTSTNGSKRGQSSFPGYNGTVFEPLDEYKGDFARTYFYMLTRYMNLVSGWQTDMLSGNNFSNWARAMLLEWDAQDPVSQKEIDRNNAVYVAQGNRNPYIDRPEFGQHVWDTSVLVNENNQSNINWWYSNSTLYVQSARQFTNIEIFNALGQQVQIASINGRVEMLNLHLTPGVYLAVARNQYGIEALRFAVQ